MATERDWHYAFDRCCINCRNRDNGTISCDILLCPLTLELAQVVTVFANVHIMSRALHCQVVHLSRALSREGIGGFVITLFYKAILWG